MKDKITNICGAIIAACGVVPVLQAAGILVPQQIVSVAITVGIIATAVIGYYTGKPVQPKG